MRVLRATDSLLIEVWFSADTENSRPRICLRPIAELADGCIPLRPNEIDALVSALAEAATLIERDQRDARALLIRKG